MKRLLTICLLVSFLTGCNFDSLMSETLDSNESNQITTDNASENNNIFESTNASNTIMITSPRGSVWSLKGNIRFVPIAEEVITMNRTLYMYTFVDLETGNMYLYTEETASVTKGGVGTTFTLLQNVDGTPCVYEELDALRQQYEYVSM